MSVRINQEDLAIAVSSLTTGGNVRLNQSEELIAVSGIVGGGNVRVNQEALLILIPVGVSSSSQPQLFGF